MADWLLIMGAVVAGFAFGALLVVALVRRPKPKQVVAHKVVAEEFASPRRAPPPAPAQAPGPDDDVFTIVKDELSPRAPPPRARPTLPPLPEANVPTEWARRQVGPLEPGRVRGICSGCGTPISVSARRPIRVACPVCGRTRLLS